MDANSAKKILQDVEKEDWISIKARLELGVFRIVFEDLTEELWQRDRYSSLVGVLNVCNSSNKSTLLEAVAKSLGKDHELVNILEKELALAKYAAPPKYGSFPPASRSSIRTKEGMGRLRCVSCVVILVLSLLMGCIALAFIITGIVKSSPTSTIQMGVNDDTVLLANLHSPWYSKIALDECLQSGDYYHRSDIFIIPDHDLVLHNRTDSLSSRLFPQSLPSLSTGTLEYLYLLENSEIDYKLCITNAGPTEAGTLYIFDNRDDYFTYQDQLNDPGQNAVFVQEFSLAPDNHTTCIEISFTVEKPSYYFLAASTPGKIFYNYTYSILTYYFNHTDYALHCSVKDPTRCDFDLPFKSEDYAILAYVHPLMDSDPFATHICLQTDRSKALTAAIAVVGATGAVALLVFASIVIFVIGRNCCSTHSRYAYTSIS